MKKKDKPLPAHELRAIMDHARLHARLKLDHLTREVESEGYKSDLLLIREIDPTLAELYDAAERASMEPLVRLLKHLQPRVDN